LILSPAGLGKWGQKLGLPLSLGHGENPIHIALLAPVYQER